MKNRILNVLRSHCLKIFARGLFAHALQCYAILS